MSKQKILVVTYYWPPSGGSGVQRWLKFVKYLPDFGWKPYVCTPDNPALVQRDESLLADVSPEAEIIRLPIWEPYNIFFKLSGGGKDSVVKPSELSLQKKKTFFQKTASWIRGNFFIPDPKIFWVRPTVKFLHQYLKEHEINNVITTGPPHSVHLIGLGLKKKNPALNWIADFRDPWSEWSFLDSFNMMSIVKARHRRLERKVLTKADHVLTITPYYVGRFGKLSKRSVELIPNGYDHEDFKNIEYKIPKQFTIRHVGIVYDMADPQPLIDALEILLNKIPALSTELVVEFVGEVNATFRQALQCSKAGEVFHFREPVPHKELMTLYGETSVLLLNLNGYKHAEGLLPGKLFEYIATGLPVLGIGPVEGNAAALLKSSGAGVMFGKDQAESIATFIHEAYLRWKKSEPARTVNDNIAYSRKSLAGKIAALLK
jgi:glycosyltransferase involved in cell wall biosynthesis